MGAEIGLGESFGKVVMDARRVMFYKSTADIMDKTQNEFESRFNLQLKNNNSADIIDDMVRDMIIDADIYVDLFWVKRGRIINES